MRRRRGSAGAPGGRPARRDGHWGRPLGRRDVTGEPPSTLHVTAILTRMAGRRFLNRLGAAFRRRRLGRPRPGEGRRATPPKSGPGVILLVVLAVRFIPSGITISAQLLGNLTAAVEGPAGDVSQHRDLHVGFRPGAWPEGAAGERLLSAVGALFTLFWLAILFATLGSANPDLGRVEWSLEWLFTFPATARALFLAKALEHGVVNGFSWLTVLPLCLVTYVFAGRTWWAAALLAIAGTLYLNLLLGAARLLIETWLRKRHSLSRVKNLQALFTVLGMLALYAVLYIAIARDLPGWLSAALGDAPRFAAWLPPALPVTLVREASAGTGAIALAAFGAAIVAAAVVAAAWIVRDGLVSSGGGAYQGTRGAPGAAQAHGLARAQAQAQAGARARARTPLARGIVGKELRLLVRDRNFLVQTLVVPFLVIGFQVLINPSWIRAGSSDLRHGAMLAFGIGAYVLMFGCFSVLSAEGQGLWLLYTLPRPLAAVLREKTRLWAAISAAYAIGLLAFVGFRGEGRDWAALTSAAMALAGIVVYAFIAAGIGVLGTNPLEQQPGRRMRPGMVYLYMLLASLYSYGIYSPGVWDKVVLVTLCSLLAFALWQKVDDRLPYLLDPTAAPPPRVGLSDGLIAALAFFCIQGLLTLAWVLDPSVLARGEPPPARVVTLAYVVSGLLVASFALYSFWRLKVPRLLETLGLRRAGPGSPGSLSLARATLLGLASGLLAAGFALLYLHTLERVPALAEWKREALRMSATFREDSGWWLALLAVVAAPVFEELIFRALIYRGLRRSFSRWPSVLASAAIFAIVHPPVSVAPVFVLGIAAALSFERTGLLAAPVAAHVVYNVTVMLLGGE
ncbi:MAG: CPBP family intramembrane metalloprotease [Planctomycetes bacterium]|nr:CPBP family intramembrane metalloprotease [Planctomycetota bacterium]